jgi:hypothetical protein
LTRVLLTIRDRVEINTENKKEGRKLPFFVCGNLDVRRLNILLVRLNRFFLTFRRFYDIMVLWREANPNPNFTYFRRSLWTSSSKSLNAALMSRQR